MNSQKLCKNEDDRQVFHTWWQAKDEPERPGPSLAEAIEGGFSNRTEHFVSVWELGLAFCVKPSRNKNGGISRRSIFESLKCLKQSNMSILGSRSRINAHRMARTVVTFYNANRALQLRIVLIIMTMNLLPFKRETHSRKRMAFHKSRNRGTLLSKPDCERLR
jgi:hypothetical protein